MAVTRNVLIFQFPFFNLRMQVKALWTWGGQNAQPAPLPLRHPRGGWRWGSAQADCHLVFEGALQSLIGLGF